MEQNRVKLHALAESFGFVERPNPFEPDEATRFRAWERAQTAINALQAGELSEDDVHHSLRVIVLTCGQLGAVEAQADAACLASALGVDLRPVLGNKAA